MFLHFGADIKDEELLYNGQVKRKTFFFIKVCGGVVVYPCLSSIPHEKNEAVDSLLRAFRPIELPMCYMRVFKNSCKIC